MDAEEVSKVKGEGSIRWEGRNSFLVNDDAGNRLTGAPHQEEGLCTRKRGSPPGERLKTRR